MDLERLRRASRSPCVGEPDVHRAAVARARARARRGPGPRCGRRAASSRPRSRRSGAASADMDRKPPSARCTRSSTSNQGSGSPIASSSAAPSWRSSRALVSRRSPNSATRSSVLGQAVTTSVVSRHSASRYQPPLGVPSAACTFLVRFCTCTVSATSKYTGADDHKEHTMTTTHDQPPRRRLPTPGPTPSTRSTPPSGSSPATSWRPRSAARSPSSRAPIVIGDDPRGLLGARDRQGREHRDEPGPARRAPAVLGLPRGRRTYPELTLRVDERDAKGRRALRPRRGPHDPAASPRRSPSTSSSSASGPGMAPNSTVVGFEATATIDRRDFGVNFNRALENGSFVVATRSSSSSPSRRRQPPEHAVRCAHAPPGRDEPRSSHDSLVVRYALADGRRGALEAPSRRSASSARSRRS